MPRWLDLSGQKFGRLAIIRYIGINPKSNGSVWEVRCDCGKITMVAGASLRSGNTQSCGCLNRERVSQKHRTHGATTNYTVVPEYAIWQAMIRRCHNENDKAFKNYGKRGIYVCGRWRMSYTNFITDMGRRPSKKHSIERKENNGPYSASNCIWALRSVQNRNHRRNRNITLGGRTQCLADWAKELGITFAAMRGRIESKWSEERILQTPNLKKNPDAIPGVTFITALGKTQSASEWSRETGIDKGTIIQRIRRGWEPDKAVSVKPIPRVDRRKPHP